VYEKIKLSKGIITCTRPGGKIATIEIPEEWIVGVRLSSNTQSPRNGPGRGSLEKPHETGERAHCLTTKLTSVGACYDAKETSCSSKELEAKHSQLTSQVQTLKQDLIRFTAETKGKIEPLLGLPFKLDELSKYRDDLERELVKATKDRLTEVDERLDWLEEEYNRKHVQSWVKQEGYQSAAQKTAQRWAKNKYG